MSVKRLFYCLEHGMATDKCCTLAQDCGEIEYAEPTERETGI
jgi:hypothetical protein